MLLWYSEISEFCICAASRNAFSKKNSFLRRPFAPWPLCSSSKYAVKYFLFLIIGRGGGSLGEWIERGEFRVYLASRSSLYLLLPLPKWISPYTNFHLFFRFQSFETSFLMELNTSPTCFNASSAHLYNSPYIVTLKYWSVFLTGSPRPIASLSPGNLLDRQILRLQSTSTESETLLCGSGICFNKSFKGIQIHSKVWESLVCCIWLALVFFLFLIMGCFRNYDGIFFIVMSLVFSVELDTLLLNSTDLLQCMNK